jgi:hypothetical protein
VGPMRDAAVTRAATYRADRVLEPVYAAHRELAASARLHGSSGRLKPA